MTDQDFPDGCLGCNREPVIAAMKEIGGLTDAQIARIVEVPKPRHAWSDVMVCPACGRAWLIKPAAKPHQAHDWRLHWEDTGSFPGVREAYCHNCKHVAPSCERMAHLIEQATHPGTMSAGDALKRLETAWLEMVGPCPGA